MLALQSNSGYVQGMSDLLSPLLMLFQDEQLSFWTFVGYMDIVVSNFYTQAKNFSHP